MIHLKTNLIYVYRWVSDMLSGKSQVRMKAASEMLIRCRLNTIKQLVVEDKLTHQILCKLSVSMMIGCGPERNRTMVRRVHRKVGIYLHTSPSIDAVKHTLYLVRSISQEVSKAGCANPQCI